MRVYNQEQCIGQVPKSESPGGWKTTQFRTGFRGLNRGWVWGWSRLTGLLVLGIGAVLLAFPVHSAADSAPMVSVPTQAVAEFDPPPPPAPSLPDLLDLLDELIDALEGAQAVIGEQRGPLGPVDALLVAVQIDLSELLLNTVLVSGYPGSANTSLNPTYLDEYASTTSGLVQDALDEASAGGDVDYDLIGSKLKTALHLITRTSPHNYRSKAGI